ncbi:MAG: anthranilate phosphoribosyltransferase [Thermodesulfobacteriota bacterium]
MGLTIKDAIKRVVGGANLEEAEMAVVMAAIMDGEVAPEAIASFITALAMKGETVDEITGAARVMRARATKVATPEGAVVVDTCGTGGDASGTFNISTAAAFVTAASGLIVAKHGGRAVTSKCGSADVLKALGVNIETTPRRMEECLQEAGIGFLFAPLLHGAMKHAAPVRGAIGIRTIFNILGPLTNPAGATCQVLGVYEERLTELMANVLCNLGVERAFVVRGEDGLDEFTLTDRTRVSELSGGEIKTYYVAPEDFGLTRCGSGDLLGGDAAENAEIILEIFKGRKGPARDIVVLNSAAAIAAGGRSATIRDACSVAGQIIDSGGALKILDKLVEVSGRAR